MSNQPASDKNTATGEEPPITPKAPWRVAEVEPVGRYRLRVSFVDGKTGIVYMRRLITGEHAGVFSCLADERQFNRVYLEHGAPTWPGDIAIAPDRLYRDIVQHGRAFL